MKYSIAVVCRGQERFLRDTLPANLELIHRLGIAQIVLLNLNSPGTTELEEMMGRFTGDITAGSLVYARDATAKVWSIPHAKNVAARLSGGEYLVFANAGSLLGNDFFQCLDHDISLGAKACNFAGTRLAIAAELFYSVRGYDESLHGWGYEDIDLYDRARLSDERANPTRRPLSPADEIDKAQSWRNGPDSDAPGIPPAQTYKANHDASVANLKDGKFIANPEGYGRAIVRVNFSEQETQLT